MTKSQQMKDPTAAASELMSTFVDMAGGDHAQAREYAASHAAQMQQSHDAGEQMVGKQLETLVARPS